MVWKLYLSAMLKPKWFVGINPLIYFKPFERIKKELIKPLLTNPVYSFNSSKVCKNYSKGAFYSKCLRTIERIAPMGLQCADYFFPNYFFGGKRILSLNGYVQSHQPLGITYLSYPCAIGFFPPLWGHILYRITHSVFAQYH